jgi:hypothetical protein
LEVFPPVAIDHILTLRDNVSLADLPRALHSCLSLRHHRLLPVSYFSGPIAEIARLTNLADGIASQLWYEGALSVRANVTKIKAIMDIPEWSLTVWDTASLTDLADSCCSEITPMRLQHLGKGLLVKMRTAISSYKISADLGAGLSAECAFITGFIANVVNGAEQTETEKTDFYNLLIKYCRNSVSNYDFRSAVVRIIAESFMETSVHALPELTTTAIQESIVELAYSLDRFSRAAVEYYPGAYDVRQGISQGRDVRRYRSPSKATHGIGRRPRRIRPSRRRYPLLQQGALALFRESGRVFSIHRLFG